MLKQAASITSSPLDGGTNGRRPVRCLCLSAAPRALSETMLQGRGNCGAIENEEMLIDPPELLVLK